jgi:TPR repeat protein
VTNRLHAVIAAIIFAALPPRWAKSQSFLDGTPAYARGDYVGATKLWPLARRGNARAQARLGFMYEYGHGVPQDDNMAAWLYRQAAEQGDTAAQFSLGLMYDKGHGVAQDEVLAHKWLNLAAAHAPPRQREYYLRLRDAVASKMTEGQVAQAQALALRWRPRRWPIE